MKTAITTTIDAYQQITDASAARSDLAARQPLANLVRATLTASADKSDETRRSYTTGIGQFLSWLGEDQPHMIPVEWQPLAEQAIDGRQRPWIFSTSAQAVVLRIITAATVDNWMAHLTQAGASDGTCAIREAAVRTFLAIADRENVITADQARSLGISPYKPRKKHTRTITGRRLSGEEVRKMRQVIDTSSPKGKRDLALIDCGLFAGLRRSEIAGLTPGDMVLDNGQWHLKVLGKARKIRQIPIHPELYASLISWMDAASIDFHDQERPLFVSIDRWENISASRIDPNVVERITTESAVAARIATPKGKNKLTPHDLRRTFAKRIDDNGVALTAIQYLLGHESPDTTARYIGREGADSARTIDRLSY